MRKKLLVVGQTPPPYHGQAIMIESIVNHKYSELSIFHIRMKFSDGKNIGKFQLRKVLMLPKLIFNILYYRLKHNVKNIYYPPAGPDYVPIIRDIIILIFTRFFFSKVIFHFHAGGVSEKIDKSRGLFKWLAKIAYSQPDLTIRLSSRNPKDGTYFKTKKEVIIPYGLKDFFKQEYLQENPVSPEILYVGVVKRTKGVSDLIEAAKILIDKGFNFHLKIVGKFDSLEYEKEILNLLNKDKQLNEHISLLGVLTGEEKWKEYGKSDIFCFPSFYECETFGTVLVEAMQYSLPIVSTKWRGIPDIVKNDESGFLVEINQPIQLAYRLCNLLNNQNLRVAFGKSGRQRYEKYFQEKRYFNTLEKSISETIV